MMSRSAGELTSFRGRATIRCLSTTANGLKRSRRDSNRENDLPVSMPYLAKAMNRAVLSEVRLVQEVPLPRLGGFMTYARSYANVVRRLNQTDRLRGNAEIE